MDTNLSYLSAQLVQHNSFFLSAYIAETDSLLLIAISRILFIITDIKSISLRITIKLMPHSQVMGRPYRQ